jgi:DNA end-binding protein Ku
VGLGQITLAGRERIIGLKPCGRGMIAETLRYEEEVREADKFFDVIEKAEVSSEQVKMAADLIKKKTAPFDPVKFKDHYELAVRAAVEAKLAGKKPEDLSEDERHEAVVINLTDALRRSLRGGRAGGRDGSGRTGGEAKPTANRQGAANHQGAANRQGAAKRKSPARKRSARKAAAKSQSKGQGKVRGKSGGKTATKRATR